MIYPLNLIWMTSRGLFKYRNLLSNISNTAYFEFCPGCVRNMAAVPQAAFAAKKIRKNEEKRKEFFCTELNPMNYSSKYMNSIWGQYNRYSVHNLKKIMDDNVFSMNVSKDKRFVPAASSVEKPISTDLGSVGSSISFSSNQIYN